MLYQELPALEARESYFMSVAASIPHTKKEARASFLRRLVDMFEIDLPRKHPEVLEHDPEKAREWFESIGARVVSKDDGNL